MAHILQKEDALLRKEAKAVPVSKIKTPELKKIIAAMKEAVRSEKDAVAIAAPQIGVSLQIFVVNSEILNPKDEQGKSKEKTPDLIFINPEIIKRSKKETEAEEGCLSVRWWYGKVRRAEKMTIRAYDENGKTFTRGGSGLLAQIFQHEIDHLNGILFTDKAKELHEMPPGETPDN